ncbi:MAG: THUMP-like domain-containing protein, partial [Bacteroidota bacterium]
QTPQRMNLLAATPNQNFCVAHAPAAAAFGRSLRVERTFAGSLRDIQRQLKAQLPAPKNKKNLPQLNVTARNCGITTDAVKKILQVSDGGSKYLFIAKSDNQFIAWLGEIVR